MASIKFWHRVCWFFFQLMICITPLLAGEPRQFILITSLYDEKNPERHVEYLQCLQKNLANPLIKNIHVFYDISNDKRMIKSSKILSFLKKNSMGITYIDNRPTFSQIFDFINSQYPGEDIIICNGDIYFDDTLGLLTGFDLSNKFIALSKWNVLPSGQLESHPWYDRGSPSWGSHDAWIFHSPITNFDKKGIALGTAYCDPYICYHAYSAHYQVFNPCLSIIAHHLHCSGIRNWELQPIKDHILEAPWCTLENIIYSSYDNLQNSAKPNQRARKAHA